jgi:hypothetical protein
MQTPPGSLPGWCSSPTVEAEPPALQALVKNTSVAL